MVHHFFKKYFISWGAMAPMGPPWLPLLRSPRKNSTPPLSIREGGFERDKIILRKGVRGFLGDPLEGWIPNSLQLPFLYSFSFQALKLKLIAKETVACPIPQDAGKQVGIYSIVICTYC